MEEENKNKFESFDDEWLTGALRARSQAAPRPGLEERILARLASEPASGPQRGWRWMPAALALALGLLLIVLAGWEFLSVRSASHQEQAKRGQPVLVQPGNPVVGNPKIHAGQASSNTAKHFARASTRNSTGPVIAKANLVPKLDRFPAETPATEQERLMAEIQRRQDKAALAQYAQDFHVIRDLEIEGISIEPLLPETPDAEPNR